MIRGIRNDEGNAKAQSAALNRNTIGYGEVGSAAQERIKQRIEITEVENGFAVTVTTLGHYTEPKVYIAVNLQEATDLIMRHAR
jgi:hypothetical protein